MSSDRLKAKLNGLVHPDLLRVMVLEMAGLSDFSGSNGSGARYVAERFASIGIAADDISVSAHNGLSLQMRGTESGPKILLAGTLADSGDSRAESAGIFDGEWMHGPDIWSRSAFAVYLGVVKAIKQGMPSFRGSIAVMASADRKGLAAEQLDNVDYVLAAQPTGLRIEPIAPADSDSKVTQIVTQAHRAVFFGRSPQIEGTQMTGGWLTLPGVPQIAYGPGGVDRQGNPGRDREMGETVSVPNLVMCTKVYALAVATICAGT